MFDIEYNKLKRKLKLAIFNEFYIESLYIENMILCKLIEYLCEQLHLEYAKNELEENLNKLIDNSEQEGFIKTHFTMEFYKEIKEWNKQFILIKTLISNNEIYEMKLKECTQIGNQIIGFFENNLILLKKYKNAEN